MTKSLPMMEAKKLLGSLPEALKQQGEVDVIEVTRRGKPVLAVMPWELYESITESLEILADTGLLDKVRQSVKEMEAGSAIPWEEAKQELAK